MKEKTQHILIIGAGVHAQVLLDILIRNEKNKIVGFTDRDENIIGKKIKGIKILGNDSIIEDLYKKKKIDSVIIGLGYQLIKKREIIYKNLEKIGIKIINAIHPNSIISKEVTIGNGCAIMAGAIINPNSNIGNNCVINTGAIIDHDNQIKNNVFIQIGAKLAGNVVVHDNSIIGMGANILEKRKIGSNSIVGAGSNVIEDVLNNIIVVGNPAKFLREKL